MSYIGQQKQVIKLFLIYFKFLRDLCFLRAIVKAEREGLKCCSILENLEAGRSDRWMIIIFAG